MCLEFPGRVVSVDEAGATVDREGRLLRASTLLVPDIAPGAWVRVAAGTIVERLDPERAERIRRELQQAISAATDPAGPTPLVPSIGGSR